MPGTAFSRGKISMDFDSYKNQEWLRRRKLRLEQVRKQSSEIARALRQKVSDDEKRRIEEYERLSNEMFKIWKAEKLEELEEKLRCALEGFGNGFRQAEAEPDPELLREKKIKMNLSKAQKRGEIAHQEQLRRNKLAKEKLISAVERKKITRKKEDLRSALIRSVPIKKQLIDIQESCHGEDEIIENALTLNKNKIKRPNGKANASVVPKKVPVKNVKKKKVNNRSYGCKYKQIECDSCPVVEAETVWINLDEMQNSSGCDSGLQQRSSKSLVGRKQKEKERSEGSLELYDFSSRYYCKSFREFPHLVERINHDSQELNANELAKIEEEMEKEEEKKKSEADVVSQGRGMEALRKEKISRDYENLIAKLEELSKKEKILKALQRNPPSFLHMNDDRLSERAKTKQRLMESKFENVYYEATARIPQTGLPHVEPISNLTGGGDYFETEERPTTKLSFSASNLKYNSPVTSSAETLPLDANRSSGMVTSQKELLRNINKALKEGRELRQSRRRKWDSESLGEGAGKGLDKVGEGEEKEGSWEGGDEDLPGGTRRTLTKCQGSQTEEPKDVRWERELLLRSYDPGDESLPVSSSTSYKSPPSVMRCHRFQEFLDYLDEARETNDHCTLKTNSKIKKKVNRILCDLLVDGGSHKSEKEERKVCAEPVLAFYIEKLLNMSRECIANLSISSENISTPNITELDLKNESEGPECEYFSRDSSEGKDLIRKSEVERVDALEKSVKNWRMILGTRLKESEKMPGCLGRVRGGYMKPRQPSDVMCGPQNKSKYDEITKKCSERILELSDMLNKVRKDKEKLLSSASGCSSQRLSGEDRDSERGFDVEEEEVVPVHRNTAESLKLSPVVDSYMNRYNLTRAKEETVSTTAVADSQSFQDLNESLESWPDVMDELLKREMITSPFKWSDGELSSEFTTVNDYRTKPSIESVIGNFRKEIDKIKPSALTGPWTEADSLGKLRWPTDGEHEDLLRHPKRSSGGESVAESDLVFQEESSVDSINRCLTSLGLNWAKSFLRKNAEARAMSSSSNSEGKFSGDEEENYP